MPKEMVIDAQLFLSLFETALPPGNWVTLAMGDATTNGWHAFGDSPDIPASDVYVTSWKDWAEWFAFPGKAGNGIDCEPHLREQIENVYRGHRCAHIFKRSGASSYHMDSGDFAIVIDLSMEASDLLQDLGVALLPFSRFSRSYGANIIDEMEEFMYPGWEALIRMADSRDELDHPQSPGPEHYRRPKPGEQPQGFWDRKIAVAQSHQWSKKKDGD